MVRDLRMSNGDAHALFCVYARENWNMNSTAQSRRHVVKETTMGH